MKTSLKILSALILGGAFIFTAPAFANKVPDMIGKWTGMTRSVVYGAGGHFGKGEAKAQFKEVPLTIEWTEQNDGRLIGSVSSALGTEPNLAVISSDGVAIITADSDGTSVGRIIDNDHFELCYTHTAKAEVQIVASCTDFERVK